MNHLLFSLYGYVKKDFLLLYKRKKYLFTFLLLPLLIGFLFLLFLDARDYTIDVAVCNYDYSPESRLALEEIDDFSIQYLDGDEEICSLALRDGISNRDFSMGIEIPAGFSENLENLEQSRINLYYDNTDVAFSNLLAWKVEQSLEPFERAIVNAINDDLKGRVSTVRGSLSVVTDSIRLSSKLEDRAEEIDSDLENIENLDTEFIVNPVWVNHIPLSDKSTKDSALAFIFPILALFVMLMLVSTSVIYDRKNLFITRVKASTSPSLYLIAKVIFFVFLTFVQFSLIYGLFLLSGANYSFNYWYVLELVFAIGVLNTLFGFFIGLVSENEGIAVLFSLIISFPLMLVSGIFYPVQTLPSYIQWFASILPLNYQINAAKQVLLFNQKMGASWMIISVVLFAVVYWFVQRRL